VQIHKLQHLVTCGSPIDKIEYFFGSMGSRTRVYDRLTDDLRGDLHDPPFSKSGRQPQLRWINYWDRGDVISGMIDTVIPSDYRRAEVKNIRIASHRLPDLAGSHAGYFSHAGFMSELFRVIFDNRCSYVDPPREPDGRPIEPVYRADSPWMLQALLFLPFAALPALLALTAAGLLLHWRSPAPLLLTVVVVSLVVFRLLHRAGFDQEEPIR
jgi:hypothetical protein